MRKGDVDRFFRELSRRLKTPVGIYLTGGVASWFWGGERPTEDIDFGLKTSKADRQGAENALQETSRQLGIPVQYSEEIGRWGTIGVSDYTEGAKLYKRFGQVTVYLLSVPCWSVGKIQRYYQSDVDDLRAVFKKVKPPPQKLVEAWVQALRESPASSSQALFVKTVEDFLITYGHEIWGRTFQPQKYVSSFRRLAL